MLKFCRLCALALIVTALTGCTTRDKPVSQTAPRRPPVVRRPPQVKAPPRPQAEPRPDAQAAWEPPVPKRLWRYIVIHHSATSVGGAARFNKAHVEQNGWDELGYHFVIGNGSDTPDGKIEPGGRWWRQKHGAHCKTPDNRYNDYGLGICLVGNFEKRGGPTPAQLASLTKLVRYLKREFGIHPKNISTHGALTHNTQCPGRHFPMASFMQSLRGYAIR